MEEKIAFENLAYLEELYKEWGATPQGIPPEWRPFFHPKEEREKTPLCDAGEELVEGVDKQGRVNGLITAYRNLGYLYADLNPLKDYKTPELEYMHYTVRGRVQKLHPKAFGMAEADWGRSFDARGLLGKRAGTLKEIIEKLHTTYWAYTGYEIAHIQNRPMYNWLVRRIEEPQDMFEDSEKIGIQNDLLKAVEFEQFIHKHFVGQKRFSLQGVEALIPAFHYLLYSGLLKYGIEEVVLGMPHRGRLNVLVNGMGRSPLGIFSYFLHNYHPYIYGGSGDVKYHQGQSFYYTEKEGKRRVKVSLVSNPSHLEAVDPVVQGRARGVQLRRGDRHRKKVLPVLMHGDAAFSGQGMVAETLNLSRLKGYQTGGTIHILINNQIGFTTSARNSRSTRFATDIVKAMPIPIFHVNGDQPEAVVRAIDLAMRWRRKFGQDIVIDIVGYRRLGHNEADEPAFTHPIMYRLIKGHPSVDRLYGETLEREGIYPKEAQEKFRETYGNQLHVSSEDAEARLPRGKRIYKRKVLNGYMSNQAEAPLSTGVPVEALQTIGKKITSFPADFSPHPGLLRVMKNRLKTIETKEGLDWGTGEALSWATLLNEGYNIRLSGEDVARGTYSQRHARWWDMYSSVPKAYVPFHHVAECQGNFDIFDSPLSELAVLGFEYGFSLTQPKMLVLWEAQFGDFVNGGQIIIDQFIASGEAKWNKASGLVLLLPHGYEGQGPDHSSGYLERFLQLSAKKNWQVCVPTTPAQYFHLLRRQLHQKFRRPLVIMTPKSFLRRKEAVSSLEEMAKGRFETVLEEGREEGQSPAKRLIFCTGKVYYALRAYQEKYRTNVKIVRIEQLYPFPEEEVTAIAHCYGKVETLLWVQEESKNRGAWFFVKDLLRKIFHREIVYAGRDPSPSSATGSYSDHAREEEEFLVKAFTARRASFRMDQETFSCARRRK